MPSVRVFGLTKVIKMPETVPIPSPPGLPLLGNIADIDSELPVKSFSHLADIYGSFFYFAKGIAEVLFIKSYLALALSSVCPWHR